MKSIRFSVLLLTLLVGTWPVTAALGAGSRPVDTSAQTAAEQVEVADQKTDADKATENMDAAVDDTDAGADADGDDELEANDPYLVGWLELDGMLVDGPPRFAWTGQDNRHASTRLIVEQLHRIAKDPRYVGVTIRLDEPWLSLTQIQEISAALRVVRAAGQTVLVAADHYDLHTYLLASAADKIVLQRKGLVELSGLGVEETYLAGLLELIGAKADLLQIGQYKGADESMTRTSPSEAWSSNIGALLDDLYALFIEKIGENRGARKDQVETLMRRGWEMAEEQFVESGLVDHIADRDLVEVTGLYFGDDFEWDDLLAVGSEGPNLDNPFALFSVLFKEPTTVIRRPSLAVIHVLGPIVTGDSDPGGMIEGESVGSTTMIQALADARDNDLIKGVVLRIDSPGGSALASELIWQAVRELGETKPVYASVGSMAASGGYYIACAAHEVYASPGSILGSIGVVGGKIVLGGLYSKIGVTVHRRSRGPLGDMFNSVDPFNDEQRKVLNRAMTRIYDQFTDRVAIGRGKRIGDIAAVAQGRLFTGRQSVGNGLADKVGGLDTVLTDLAGQLDLKAGSYDVINLPEPKGFSELLESWFAVQTSSKPVRTRAHVWLETARAALGPRRWRAISPIIEGAMLLRREHVLTLLPTAVVVH